MLNKFLLIFILTLSFIFSQFQLNAPHKVFLKDSHIYINTQSNKSILSQPIIENLRFKIPITVTYYIDFYEKVFFFFNKRIESLKITKEINYDIWSRHYFVTANQKISKILNLTQLKNNVNYLRNIRLTHIRNIKSSKKYFFRSRVSLQKKNLSIYFHLINNILSVLNPQPSYFESSLYLGDDLLNILSN